MEPIEIYDAINNKHINVYVTSEVAEKCRTDNEFAQDLFNKLQDQNIEDGSAIEIETIKCEVEEPQEPVVEERSVIETWGRRETLKLIKSYQKHSKTSKEYPHTKTLWPIIANDLAQQGIEKTADKCAKKWRNLVRTYKNASEKLSTSTRFQYFDEMQNVFHNTEVEVSDSNTDDEKDVESDHLHDTSLEESNEKESWSRYETLKLLKYFQKLKPSRQSTDKNLWIEVSAELAKDNIQKLPEKCASKWKALYRTYKKNVNKSLAAVRFQYFQEVSNVLNDVELEDVDLADDLDFEKILNPEQFKCSLIDKVSALHAKPTKDIAAWTADETLKLIKAYKKHKHRFKICPSRKYVWAMISSELAREGIHKDIDKCENKWKGLLRSFRRVVETGESPRFNFYNAVADIVNDGATDEGDVSNIQVETYENTEFNDDEDMETEEVTVDNEDVDDGENMPYEEIIIQAESDQLVQMDDSKTWSYSEISALLKAYDSRKNNFKEKASNHQLWEEVSRELASQNMYRSPENCENKWKSLYTLYKTHKMNNTGPGKFSFYKEIDRIFKESQLENSELEGTIIHNTKCKCLQKKMLEKQQRHIERMQLLKRKLDLEERKVEAFEYYVKQLKKTNGQG